MALLLKFLSRNFPPITTIIIIITGIFFGLSALSISFNVSDLQIVAQTSIQNRTSGNASDNNATAPLTSPLLTSGNANNASGNTTSLTSTPILTTDNITSIVVAILSGAGTLGVTSLTAHYNKKAEV